MRIKESIFAGSSAEVDGKPKEKLPEFAFIGRSNVGKSSLINMLCGNSKLAMTSSQPGKTRLVNHFRINGEWYLVDLPGYGFAKMSVREKKKLEDVIRNYLNFSEEMVHLFVLIDCRHDLMKADREFISELGGSDIPFSIIFTKGDKLGPVARERQTGKILSQMSEILKEQPAAFASSSETGLGKEEILGYIRTVLDNLGKD